MRRQRPDGFEPARGFKHAAPRTASSLSPMRQSQRLGCPKTGHAASSGRNGAARTSESNRRGSMINNRVEKEAPSPLNGFDYDAMGEACGRAQRLCDVMSFGCLALLNDSQGQQVSKKLYPRLRPYIAYTYHSAFTPNIRVSVFSVHLRRQTRTLFALTDCCIQFIFKTKHISIF